MYIFMNMFKVRTHSQNNWMNGGKLDKYMV